MAETDFNLRIVKHKRPRGWMPFFEPVEFLPADSGDHLIIDAQQVTLRDPFGSLDRTRFISDVVNDPEIRDLSEATILGLSLTVVSERQITQFLPLDAYEPMDYKENHTYINALRVMLDNLGVGYPNPELNFEGLHVNSKNFWRRQYVKILRDVVDPIEGHLVGKNSGSGVALVFRLLAQTMPRSIIGSKDIGYASGITVVSRDEIARMEGPQQMTSFATGAIIQHKKNYSPEDQHFWEVVSTMSNARKQDVKGSYDKNVEL